MMCGFRAPQPLHRRQDDDHRGRCLVAASAIPKDRLIFCERPLVALQSLGNPVLVCHHCKAFVGGPWAALRWVATGRRPSADAMVAVVPCRHGCGQVYCSSACEEDFWHDRHEYLCTGRIEEEDHPLIGYKRYAVASNEIFLLVAEWMVAEHSYRNDDPRATNPWRDFSSQPWWDLEPDPEIGLVLKRLCREAGQFWIQHWTGLMSSSSSSSSYAQAALHMAHIIGACELNAIGIDRRHPLCRDIADRQFRLEMKQEILTCLQQAGMLGGEEEEEEEEDDEGETDDQAVGFENDNSQALAGMCSKEPVDECIYTDDDVARILSGLDIHEAERIEREQKMHKECDDNCEDNDHDDLDVIFPPLDGTAMYALACKMNHSCEPNVIVLYKTRGWGRNHPLVAFCVALRDIQEGEELCISYINSDDPLEKRQELLQHYGFTCQCSKCTRESSLRGSGEDSKVVPVVDPENDVLFGSDDSNGGDDDDDTVNGGEEDDSHEVDGEIALGRTFSRLDIVRNHQTLGSIPIAYLAQASTFVIQTATAAREELRDKDGSMSELLQEFTVALSERNFVLAKKFGARLEAALFTILRTTAQWPSSAYRRAYWSAAVTASVGLAHECSFLSAMEYLDKAIILGLNRQTVEHYFGYVELHASQMATSPCPPALLQTFIFNYNLPAYHAVLYNDGLSQPIQYPIPEDPLQQVDESTESYILQSLPVVVRRYAIEWPAIQKWRDLSFFCVRFGHRLVPIELGSMKSDSGMKEELMTVRELVSGYLVESAQRTCWTLQDAQSRQEKVAYLAQHPLVEQLPELGCDIDGQPTLCGKEGPSHIYLWIGTGGTRTPLHFDSYSNLFVQLVGVKYIRIYDKEETPNLYVSENGSYDLQGNMSAVDCEQEDYMQHPLAKYAVYKEVILFPGDALFIPARAWHYVRSLTTSISVNFWF